jgi:glycogen synthase
MYVLNDCTSDTRVLREADTLALAGHDVTIVARLPATPMLPEVEERPSGARLVRVRGDDELRARWREQLGWIRYPWRARGALAARVRREARRPPKGWLVGGGLLAGALAAVPWIAYRFVAWRWMGDRLPAPASGGQIDHIIGWRRWVEPWAANAARVAPQADVHHGHDLTGLVAAALAAARSGSGPGLLVYDSHELYVESGRHARKGRIAKAWLRRLERRLSRGAVGLVTVNATLERELRARLGFRLSVVVHNAPPRWTPPIPGPNLLRERLGLGPTTSVALYHGGLLEGRGLPQLAAALDEPGMADVHLAIMGNGPLRERLAATIEGAPGPARIHLLDAVPPDELAIWVASADVGVMPNQPVNANERLSTPNKLFESIAVGLPVVSSDFPERRRIILGDPDGPLGALCDPADPASIAKAIRSLLDLSPDRRDDLRRRILRAAHERWNWETEGGRLVRFYDEIGAPAGRGPA